MPNVNYAVVATGNSNEKIVPVVYDKTPTGFSVQTNNIDTGTGKDGGHSVVVHASSTVTPTYTWTRDGTTLKTANDGDDVVVGGDVKLTTRPEGCSFREDGVIQVSRTGDGSTVFAAYKEGDASATSQIYNDGSATFESYIRVNRNDIRKACFQASNPNGVNGTIYSNGDAAFNGKVTASNVTFNLEPDNVANFSAEGEYTGPTLDVKESIRTIQAALYRLKAAVLLPDASVDQLRLRILEALETISEEEN
jgi:hypothetical protein